MQAKSKAFVFLIDESIRHCISGFFDQVKAIKSADPTVDCIVIFSMKSPPPFYLCLPQANEIYQKKVTGWRHVLEWIGQTLDLPASQIIFTESDSAYHHHRLIKSSLAASETLCGKADFRLHRHPGLHHLKQKLICGCDQINQWRQKYQKHRLHSPMKNLHLS